MLGFTQLKYLEKTSSIRFLSTQVLGKSIVYEDSISQDT